MFFDEGKDNKIEVEGGVSLKGFVRGNNNHVKICDTAVSSSIDLKITGSNNKVFIGSGSAMRALTVYVGSYTQAFGASVIIGEKFSVEADSTFFVYNSGNKLEIGDNCMFSNNVILRTGEAPHLIFDLETGQYIDEGGHIIVGSHSWVGERAYLTKRAQLAPETIVAACAVVTGKFSEENIVLGGNPAKIVKRGVQWIRNRSSLEEGSKFQKSYLNSVESFRSRQGD